MATQTPLSALFVAGAACSVQLQPKAASALAGRADVAEVAVDPRAIDGPGIEANLVLFSVAGTRLLLVTLDLLFVGPTLSRAVRDAVAEVAPTMGVWISASHTHNAPAVDVDKPRLGSARTDVVAGLCAQVEAAVRGLLAAKEAPARLFSRVATADMTGLSVHRRAHGRLRITRQGIRRGGIVMAPNFAGTVQQEAVRVDWIDEAGTVRFVMWHWACHPTAFPNRLRMSADYVGVVREAIRDEVGQVPVLFFQGFAGDIRPPTIRTWRTNPLRRALIGPGFRRLSQSEYCEWSEEVARRVVAARHLADTNIVSQGLGISHERLTYDAEIFVKGSRALEVVIQKVAIGPLRILGVSAEPSYSHVPIDISSATDWYCGYIENVFGYLPTEEQFFEGGYEVDGFCTAFECDSLVPNGIRTFSAIAARAFMGRPAA